MALCSLYFLLACLHLRFVQGQVRLTRGPHPWEGTVEVFYSGSWGTVCDDSWSLTNTQVLCRQLGFDGPGIPTFTGLGRRYGLTIWMDDVRCVGTERTLESCPFNGWGQNDCGDENVSVKCNDSPCHSSSLHCENGGQCVTQGSRVHCQCPSTVTGNSCETDVDECAVNNGGCSHLCSNHNKTGYNCSCPDSELELGPDMHTCYSPHAGITCTSSGMSVTLDKTGLAGLRPEYLKVDSDLSQCQPRDTPGSIIFNLPLNDCGTTRKDEGSEWVYENHITSRQESTAHGLVSHVRRLNVTVRCRYPKIVHVHHAYDVHAQQLAFRQDKDGQFPVQLDFVQGDHVYEPGSAALVVDPGASFSLHFSLHEAHPELELFTNSCVATPSPDASDPALHYSLLTDGCSLDSTMENHRNGSEQQLTLQAFKFVDQPGTVFLHCDVIICNTSDPTSRCQQGCLQPSTSSPAKREEEGEKFRFLDSASVSVGPFHFASKVERSASGDYNSKEKLLVRQSALSSRYAIDVKVYLDD